MVRSLPAGNVFLLFCYHVGLKCLVSDHETAGTVEGAEKGAALLNKLEEMFKSGEIDFKPDIVSI